jgi:hypothetical protein
MRVDDQTAIYVLATRNAFEDLRQVVSQLAGLLVLAAAKGTGDSPSLEPTSRLLRQAEDALSNSPFTDRAAPHHAQLVRASAHLKIALQRAGVRIDVDEILPPLRAGYDALQAASRTLPGFEMVAFEQGCCSALPRITR